MAIFIFFDGAQLIKFGIITTPAVTADADRKKFLLENVVIITRFSGFRL